MPPSTDSMSGCGAAIVNLSHCASVRAIDWIAPLVRGIDHLGVGQPNGASFGKALNSSDDWRASILASR